MKSVKSFADYFYFECAAKRTSKRVADSIQKANKAARSTERMEAQFTVNQESINDRFIVRYSEKFQSSGLFFASKNAPSSS